jgi:hypothetical protein
MAAEAGPSFFHCGRDITPADVEYVKEFVKTYRRLCPSELADTLCEHWGWVTASGANRRQACLKLLARLEHEGQIELPPTRKQRPHTLTTLLLTERTSPRMEVEGPLSEVAPVTLGLVTEEEQSKLWKEYMERYHYLGYKRAIGFVLRYFIESKRGRLGCFLVGGASKSVAVRDEWIGWSYKQRMRNLPWVMNNQRMLIFPWVKVQHLASHVLGQLARQVGDDVERQWGFRPLLLETYVDPERYQGTCYQAAGWVRLGMSAGTGRPRRGQSYTTSPKILYVKPLARDFKQQLCSEQLQGRVIE